MRTIPDLIDDDWKYGRTALQEGIPFILPAALSHLETILPSISTVFEWGSGGSTVYWARHCADVTSVEQNPGWIVRTSNMLSKAALSADLWLIRGPPRDPLFTRYAGAILLFPDDTFDLVFVDGERVCRHKCLQNAIAKVRPGGWIMVDNSNWFDLDLGGLEGWERDDYVVRGLTWVGVEDPYDWHTTILRRPL